MEQSKAASSVPNELLNVLMDSNGDLSSIYISRAQAVSLHQGKLFGLRMGLHQAKLHLPAGGGTKRRSSMDL